MEFVTVLGLMGIGSYIAATLMTASSQSQSKAQMSTDFQILTNIANFVVNSGPAACTNSLNLTNSPLAFASLSVPGKAGFNPVGVSIYGADPLKPFLKAGGNFASIQINSIQLQLLSLAPVSISQNGTKSYLAALQIAGLSKLAPNPQQPMSTPQMFLSLSTDSTGKTVTGCSTVSKGTEIPNCTTTPGQVLGSKDGQTLGCVPLPSAPPPSSLQLNCATAGGIMVDVINKAGQTVTLCRINDSSCPSPLVEVPNFSSTRPNTCYGGATWGFCATRGVSCTTGYHAFGDTPAETCNAPKLNACGPATMPSSDTVCQAEKWAVGCADFETACRAGGGLPKGTDRCIYNRSSCPSGMNLVGTATMAKRCYGGTEWNCNSGDGCLMGSHLLSNLPVESCTTYMGRACGGFTNDISTTCYADVVQVECSK